MKTFLFLFILITAVLSVATVFIVVGIFQSQQFGYGTAIEAHVLLGTPEKYFSLDNPDFYLLEAISNPEKLVFVNLDDTQIDEMIQTNGINNIEYKNNYYEIQLLSVDPGSFGYLGPLISGWVLLGVCVIVVIIIRFSRKSLKQQPPPILNIVGMISNHVCLLLKVFIKTVNALVLLFCTGVLKYRNKYNSFYLSLSGIRVIRAGLSTKLIFTTQTIGNFCLRIRRLKQKLIFGSISQEGWRH